MESYSYMPIIKSILDTDWYKLTMQQLIFCQFPSAIVRYEFFNRGETKFPVNFGINLQRQVELMSFLKMTDDEFHWLLKHDYLKRTYLEWLRGYTFNPKEVKVTQENGTIKVVVEAPWYRGVLWEVPLLATISELYYTMTEQGEPKNGWACKIKKKGEAMQEAGCKWADFGTRRRHSFAVQEKVVAKMRSFKGFLGTSNPHLAMKHDLSPIGTYAHEGPMAMQAFCGLRQSNKAWLQRWLDEFDGHLGIALPDTLSSEVFFRDFGLREAKTFDGLRQDSGDPVEMGERYLAHYKSLGINAQTKRIIFSDGLTDKLLIELTERFKTRIHVAGGIGTYLTNDVGYVPLNIVMKLTEANFGHGPRQVVKFSDSVGKWTGHSDNVRYARWELGI